MTGAPLPPLCQSKDRTPRAYERRRPSVADQETIQKRLQSQYKNGPRCGIDKGCFWSGGILPPVPPTPPTPPVGEDEVQHTWKQNGAFPSTPNSSFDTKHCFGFAGKVNFVIADRTFKGAGGTTEVTVKKNGVTILSTNPDFVPGDGDDVCEKGVLDGVQTFTAFDQFEGVFVSRETGPAMDLSLTVDVSRTGP